jgi:hypothetical protein
VRAEVASERCATEGGLKEESRMYSVLGCVDVGLTVLTMRNLDGDEVKELSVDSNSGRRDLIRAIREAMSSIISMKVVATEVRSGLVRSSPWVYRI